MQYFFDGSFFCCCCLTFGTDSGGVGCLKQTKLGSPATSSQPNNNEINFPMPRLASPAIPSIHSISGLSSLHLMQQHNLSTGDLMPNRPRNQCNDARSTPPHTETSKFTGHIDSLMRNDKNQRHHINAIEQQLKHLSNKNISHSNTTNNNNTKSNNNNNNIKDIPVSKLSPFTPSTRYFVQFETQTNTFFKTFSHFIFSLIRKRNRMQRKV